MAHRWSAGHVARQIAEALHARGYALSDFGSESATLATIRGYSLGRLLPFTDFIFVVDLDAEKIATGEQLEALHQRHREYGEGQMRVPRPLRYRVPNSVTVGVRSAVAPEDMIGVARKSRHAVNSGEKNAVYLVDLASGAVHCQGLERDPLRYGGTWSSGVNPSNRTNWLLTEVFASLGLLGGPERDEAGE